MASTTPTQLAPDAEHTVKTSTFAVALFGAPGKRGPKGTIAWVVFLILTAGSLAALFASPTKPLAGVAVIALMLVMLFFKIPVAVALAVPSLIGVYAVSGIPATVNLLSSAPYSAVSKWAMAVVPMFIFMGMALGESGITTKIYQFTDKWFGWLPGGAGIGTTAAGIGLSSVSGSTLGMTYTLGRAGIPEMLRAGYHRRIALGVVIVAGLPGMLIPPSVLLVVYAGIAEVPVGPQLLAGTLPGILLGVTFALFLLCLSLMKPAWVGRDKSQPRPQASTMRERLLALRDIWGLPVIVFVLFGGMFSGLFTATDAGAAAAFATLLLTLWLRRGNKPWAAVARAAVSTVSATGVIFFILIGAEMLTRLLAVTGLAQLMTDSITGLGLSRVAFLVILVVLYLFMGMFFDTFSMMLLTVPILLPVLAELDVNPLWLGVFVVLLAEIGQLTPPLGVLSFVLHGLAQDPKVNLGQKITLIDVFVAVLYFLPIVLLFVIALIAFPELATWLPDLAQGGMP
ncbi:TRAP transporter large permease [Microbacterium sp.]|uniref:TRAP transporter large permease n=1 Tax=Microbacterium sp. TaxID=51671 RepID=UPI00260D8EF6|nr:TRAP transporter large permease [Microbacterium sp.]